MPLNSLQIWFQAARPFTFTASVTPVLLGGVLALGRGHTADWFALPLFLICAVLFHAATNLISDYTDFLKGVDKDYTFGSSGVLVAGLLSPRQVKAGAHVLFGIGFVLGLTLVALRGFPILALGLIGIAGGYTYTGRPLGYKYFALGDVLVFILMGVLLVVGADYALTGVVSARSFWVSLPISALVTAILYANNLRDIRHDAEAGVRTLAGVIGGNKAKRVYYGLVAFAYFSVAGMILAGILSLWSLLVFVSCPLAVRNMKMIREGNLNEPAQLATADVATAQLHLSFGLLLIVSLVLEVLV